MSEQFDAADPFGILDGYTPPEDLDQGDETKKLVQKLDDALRTAREAKYELERDWEIHFSYLCGDFLIVRNRHTGDLLRLGAEASKRLRSVNNKLRPINRSFVGKLSKTVPTWKVIPATADWEELEGAKVADLALQYARRKDSLDLLYLDLMSPLGWAGNSFAEVLWRWDLGREVAVCTTCKFFDYDKNLVGQPCPSCTEQRTHEEQVQQTNFETLQAEAIGQVLMELPPDVEPSPDMMPNDVELPPLEQTGPLSPDAEIPTLELTTEGDFKARFTDARDVFLPPGHKCIESAPWIAVRELVHVSEARKRYPEYARYISSDPSVGEDGTDAWRYGVKDRFSSTDLLKEHCWIKRFYERPTQRFPKGRQIVQIGKLIVENKELDFCFFDRHPVFHFGADLIDGQFWREPWIKHAWPRQKELNNVETSTREHVELLLRPKFLNPLGSRISTDEISATSEQIISYSASVGKEPHFLEVPSLPSGFFNRREELIADMRTSAAVTESDVGELGSDPNARAAAIVNAESDQTIGPIIARNNVEWKALGKLLLLIMKHKYAEDRTATVTGPQGTVSFALADMNIQPGFDVDLEEEDGLSRNSAIRQGQAMNVAQLGNGAFFVNPRTGMFDAKMFARYAGIKPPEAGKDLESMQRATACKVPYLIMQGKGYQPQLWDDPMVFEEELRGWLCGPGRIADPMVVGQVAQIWQYYSMWMAGGMMPQAGGPMGAGPMGAGPSQSGQMSAPGGTPNNPMNMGSNPQASIGEEAESQIQQADQTGENLARQAISHEG